MTVDQAAAGGVPPRGRGKAGSASSTAQVGAYVIGAADLRLWGLTPVERLRRNLRRLGITSVCTDAEALPDSGHVVLLRGDYVYDEPVIAGLAARPGTLLEVPEATGDMAVAAHVPAEAAPQVADYLARRAQMSRPAGLRRLLPADLGGAHRKTLRKRSPPFVLPLTASELPRIEKRMFAGVYKGVTDLVTKWLWPIPARWATRQAARLRVHPNMVTAAGVVLMLLALGCFATGSYAAGLIAAWAMAFLDTVDGKLARLTLTSSKLGNALDHGTDLLHPPFWYVAWGFGLEAAGTGPPLGGLLTTLLVVVIGYLVGRLIEGFFIWRYGIEIHTWRRADSLFRLVTARRNPNLVLLTGAAILGRPELGLTAVAAWTVLSTVFHLVRVGQALAVAGWRGRLTSWLAEDAGAGP